MFLTPTGGPLLRPSSCNLDEFIADGLQRRKRQREKLCTGLYSNLHQRYRICTKYTVKEWPDREVYEIRNLLWARVMRLAGARGVSRPRQDVEAAQRPTKPVSATGLVDHIVLESLADTKDSKMSSHILSVHGDVGELRARILVGLQVRAAVIGLVVAVGFQTPYAILCFLPLLLKIMATFLHLRRQPLEGLQPAKINGSKGNQSPIDGRMFELDRMLDNDHSILISGSTNWPSSFSTTRTSTA